MLFIAGLETLEKPELVRLVAQLEVFKTSTLLKCGCSDFTQKIRQRLGHLPKANSDVAPGRGGAATSPGSELERAIEKARYSLETASDADVKARLRGHLADLAHLPSVRNMGAVASGLIIHAAKSFKIDPAAYSTPFALESVVFEACVRDLVDQIKSTLEKMSPADSAKLEALLREELSRISDGDAEAIRRTTGIEDLSAKALLSFLKTSSSTAVASLVIGNLGFAPFLALATAMKAVALLFGVTLPFGAYTAASSTLAFILSGPFFLVALAVIGSVSWNRADVALRDQLVRLVILVGRANTLKGEVPSRNV